MEAKLFKTGEDFVLEVEKKNVPAIAKVVGQAGRHPDWVIIASTDRETNYLKLSLKNCQAIENGYDLDKLAENHFFDDGNPKVSMYSFKVGFKKAMEVLGDKKFSEGDMLECWNKATNTSNSFYDYIQSLQQTEWGVEVATEFVEEEKTGLEDLSWGRLTPELDADGCLILKRI